MHTTISGALSGALRGLTTVKPIYPLLLSLKHGRGQSLVPHGVVWPTGKLTSIFEPCRTTLVFGTLLLVLPGLPAMATAFGPTERMRSRG
jgi:hypothetical protein